jgi:hypothetical protein
MVRYQASPQAGRSSSGSVVDAAIGSIILANFIAHLLVSRHRFHDLLHPLGLADITVIISFPCSRQRA